MKFELGQKEAIITGDIESNNVSIDVNNIDFLVTILSTSLYSKPIESFVREITSNAWDSHVEAGVEEPVILELGKDPDGKFFTRIQDFGVGLSPERFDKIYRNIGSSTKRQSNAQIGGFGIGRFSALAYSDTVHITSNYEGWYVTAIGDFKDGIYVLNYEIDGHQYQRNVHLKQSNTNPIFLHELTDNQPTNVHLTQQVIDGKIEVDGIEYTFDDVEGHPQYFIFTNIDLLVEKKRMQYKYLMYKDGNTISIDLLYDTETTERNGVEVLLYVKDGDLNKFKDAIRRQLVYFENLYVEDNTDTYPDIGEEFNNFIIKRYDNFAVNSLDGNKDDVNVLLGKVKYPLRFSALTKQYPKYVANYPISLIFNIGDLEVTPNREEILYSVKNIRMIEEVLDKSLAQINLMLDDYKHKDYDDLKDYYQAIVDGSIKVPLLKYDENDSDDNSAVFISLKDEQIKRTLNGVYYKPKPFKKTYSLLTSKQLLKTNYKFSNGQISFKSHDWSINNLKDSYYSRFFFSDVPNLNVMAKNYIRDKFESGSYFFDTKVSIKHYFRQYMKTVVKSITDSKKNYIDPGEDIADLDIAKLIFKYFLKLIPEKYQSFGNNDVPLDYIQEKKEEAKLKRLQRNNGVDWSENVNLFELQLSNRGKDGIISPNNAYLMKDLRQRFKRVVVYAEKGDENIRTAFRALEHLKNDIKFVEIAPTKIKLLKNIDNFIPIEDMINANHRIIRKIATARYIQKELPFLDDLSDVKNIDLISVKLDGLIKDLSAYTRKYLKRMHTEDDEAFFDEILSVCEDKGYFDENTKAKYTSNLNLLKQSEMLLLFSQRGNGYGNRIPVERVNVITDYILARKLFRPDVSAVYKLKKQTILNKEEQHEGTESSQTVDSGTI